MNFVNRTNQSGMETRSDNRFSNSSSSLQSDV